MVTAPAVKGMVTAPAVNGMVTAPAATRDTLAAVGLVVDGISVTIGSNAILRQLSLAVSGSSITTVMGPSGSGKSTLLRAIAGLTPIDAGRIAINERDITAVPTHQRRVGMVFQDLALFPHLDVGENIAYGLRRQRVPRQQRENTVRELLALVQLDGAASRSVATLSGGEQQRIALARALAPKPEVLLLDEPFASLDEELKHALIPELGAILRERNVTVVHVTHDKDEAQLLGATAVLRMVNGALTG